MAEAFEQGVIDAAATREILRAAARLIRLVGGGGFPPACLGAAREVVRAAGLR